MDDAIRLIESEGDRIYGVGKQHPDAGVPQYPGWKVSDLLAHTGAILGRTVAVCRDQLLERPPSPRPDEDQDPVEFYKKHLDEAVEVLSSTPADLEVWGFGPKPTVGGWVTRMVVEVGVHRYDAESAVGNPMPLLDAVAVAGLDEYTDMWFPRIGAVSSLRMVASDLGESWEFGPTPILQQVEGSASDLYLRLMSRPSAVELPSDWAHGVDGLAPPSR